jgi:hypothetical protein
VDELVTAVAWAVVRKDHAEALARLAVDEGGFGNYADKVAKINKRVTGVLADMTGLRTVGIVEELPSAGLVKIAKPVGVVAALIPTTGPDATPPVKTLFALKGRNAIICAPHPRTTGATEAVVGFMRAACEQVGAPPDLVQSLPAPSLAKTQELMRHADLIVATGGAGMVQAAYSSGTPAYGVGVGNAVHVVDETADLADAASAILTAKTFDYATVPAHRAEDDQRASAVRRALARLWALTPGRGGGHDPGQHQGLLVPRVVPAAAPAVAGRHLAAMGSLGRDPRGGRGGRHAGLSCHGPAGWPGTRPGPGSTGCR